MQPDWNTLISDCLHGEHFMALASYGSDGLWNNPVFYAWDTQSNFYFISELDCRHMRNIQSNNVVSCTIFPTSLFKDSVVFGTYIKGTAEVIFKNHPNWKHADKTYYDRVFPDDADGLKRSAPDSYRNKDSWYLVKISPTEMSYFDTRYFDEVRVDVPKELYS